MRTILATSFVIATAGSAFAAPCLPNAKPPAETLEQIGQMSGGLLSSKIRDYVVADPSKVGEVKSAAEHAGSDAANAIGAGLGAAALLCARHEPAAGRGIQEFVLALNSPDVTKSFEAVSGDLQTAAVADDPAPPDRVVSTLSGSGENPSAPRFTNVGPSQSNFSASITVTNGPLSSYTTSTGGARYFGTTATTQSLATQTVVFASVSASR